MYGGPALILRALRQVSLECRVRSGWHRLGAWNLGSTKSQKMYLASAPTFNQADCKPWTPKQKRGRHSQAAVLTRQDMSNPEAQPSLRNQGGGLGI